MKKPRPAGRSHSQNNLILARFSCSCDVSDHERLVVDLWLSGEDGLAEKAARAFGLDDTDNATPDPQPWWVRS